MTKYKRVDTKNGRVMYFVDGKMTSVEDIPVSIKTDLTANSELERDAPPREEHFVKPKVKLLDRRICVFEGEPAISERFINEQLIGLCKDHRRGKTTGEIAQAMREKQEQ